MVRNRQSPKFGSQASIKPIAGGRVPWKNPSEPGGAIGGVAGDRAHDARPSKQIVGDILKKGGVERGGFARKSAAAPAGSWCAPAPKPWP